MIPRLALLAALAFGTATAASAAARSFPTAAQIKTAFDAIDTSGNDAIALDEWDKASFALFRAADKNNNGFIDPEELQANSIPQETFLRADTDHNGKLAPAEFVAWRRTLFRLADIDRNGTLDRTEYELMIIMEQVGWSDNNGNGRIELSELRESLTKAFSEIDTDQDGFLTAEGAKFMTAEQFKRFDTNHDGKLSLEEFIAGYRAAILGE